MSRHLRIEYESIPTTVKMLRVLLEKDSKLLRKVKKRIKRKYDTIDFDKQTNGMDALFFQ